MIHSEIAPTEHLVGGHTEVRKMVLTIVMPVYNERATVADAVGQILDIVFPCPIELIVVDDGSHDGTSEVLAEIRDPRVVVHRHLTNLGKGAAILTGISLAKGTHMVPFDADLEYSPQDLVSLVVPVITRRAEIVYGPRLFGTNTVYQSYRYAMGNKITTFAANILFDSYISDLHTCLKLVPLTLVSELCLREKGFGFDTELTAELLRQGYRPFEVPVSYRARTRSEGKKLDWRDGLACIAVLVRVRLRGRARGRQPPQESERTGELQLLPRTGPVAVSPSHGPPHL
jgi:glycosyltransferase involved in cell wall biosynthesis